MASGRSEKDMIQEVDLESFDLKNDLFNHTYGKETMEAAGAQTRILQEKAQQRNPSVGFVNKGLDVRTNARLSVMDRERVYDSDWTESCLNLLESWYAACKTSSEAHAAAARACRKKHRMITVPVIFVSTIGTALAFFSAGESCDANSDDSGDNIKYAVAAMTSITAVLTGVTALYSFNTKMSENINAAGNYEILAKRAEIQIFLPNKLKSHSELVLETISAEYANLVSSSPLL
jgi:hypothetical protein